MVTRARKPRGRQKPAEPVPDHPYLDLAIATGFAFLRDGDWIPLLVEFRQPDRDRVEPAVQEFTRLEWLPAEVRQWAYVPPVFAEVTRTLGGPGLPLVVLLLQRDRVREIVASEAWRTTILRAEVGPPVFLSEKVAADRGPLPPAAAPTGKGIQPQAAGARRAVIGVIDQGIAFAHQRLRNKSGSRVAYVWQQEFLVPFSSTGLGNEIVAQQIDTALDAAHGDEERVYRSKGGLEFATDGYKPLAHSRSHGTSVLDIAAGAPPGGDVTSMPIVAVDMPERAIGDPAGSTLTPHALWGLVYLLLRAGALVQPGETLPVIANISYGPHEGPHDGTSMFERYADLLIEQTEKTPTPLRIVLAAGNFRQSRVHARAVVPAGQSTSLNWRLQPCDRTPSALELWWPAGVALSVTLRSPTNELITVSPTHPVDQHPGNAPLQFTALYSTPAGSTRTRVVLFIVPTELDLQIRNGHPVAPSGVWEIELANPGPAAVEVKAWIKRGDTPAGRRAKGRQAYFDAPDYLRYDATTRPVVFDDAGHPCAVSRFSTLSGIATGIHTTVVGGYRCSDGEPAPYSSIGPHENPGREERAPSLLAASDDSVVLRGVRAAGTRSGSVTRISGTSAAAPRVTRWLAEQWISTGKLPDIAKATLTKHPPVGVAPTDGPAVVGHGLLP